MVFRAKSMSALEATNWSSQFSKVIGRIYTRDELSDAEFILEDDLPIPDDLASRDRYRV